MNKDVEIFALGLLVGTLANLMPSAPEAIAFYRDEPALRNHLIATYAFILVLALIVAMGVIDKHG